MLQAMNRQTLVPFPPPNGPYAPVQVAGNLLPGLEPVSWRDNLQLGTRFQSLTIIYPSAYPSPVRLPTAAIEGTLEVMALMAADFPCRFSNLAE
jgi:hypothetical protein